VEVDVEKLRTLRAERFVSLRELSETSGVSKDTIWRLENGRSKRAYPSTVRKIAGALGVEPKELVKAS
jgi:transcriptional regulator with XRE-family HTH domain